MSSHGSRQFDAMAKSRGRYLPVESAMPGTTLELIPMEVLLGVSLGVLLGVVLWGGVYC
jgi:type III secretory pathway component EscT